MVHKKVRPRLLAAAEAQGEVAERISTHTLAQSQSLAQYRTQVGFAAWCQSPAPHALGLDQDIVGFICRLMQRSEMHGITGIGLLEKTLRLNRTKLMFRTEGEWNSVMLSGRVMWQAFVKGGKS